MLYRINRSIRDDNNGISVVAGQIIDCENKDWINRMGRSLTPISKVPENVIAMKLNFPDEIAEVKVEKKVISKIRNAKVVLDSDNK